MTSRELYTVWAGDGAIMYSDEDRLRAQLIFYGGPEEIAWEGEVSIGLGRLPGGDMSATDERRKRTF